MIIIRDTINKVIIINFFSLKHWFNIFSRIWSLNKSYHKNIENNSFFSLIRIKNRTVNRMNKLSIKYIFNILRLNSKINDYKNKFVCRLLNRHFIKEYIKVMKVYLDRI